SFSADGPSAPAPQAKCTKTADPDPKIPPACKPPPIRDRKTESPNPRYGEGFFSKLLGRNAKSRSESATCAHSPDRIIMFQLDGATLRPTTKGGVNRLCARCSSRTGWLPKTCRWPHAGVPPD